MLTREEIRSRLEANIDRPIRLVLSDGDSCFAVPLNTDDEGFVYNVEEAGILNQYWTRFEAIVSIEPIQPAAQP
jgi:hypothetical protein